jgi:hypothetical protein
MLNRIDVQIDVRIFMISSLKRDSAFLKVKQEH